MPADVLFTINRVFLHYTIIPVFFLLLGMAVFFGLIVVAGSLWFTSSKRISRRPR